ncbi:Clp protease N-terminal domain-containing protein [Rhodococcus phenolicus]|uniref:Clp protease N-terminal domain-containing protein n=1 Tax=Rhodococcus phenolicus TaxID=263849 RepID=UPI000833EC99|nr:Clp protease N-terminal domain-containing protein [Rhodococcus phenolicus]
MFERFTDSARSAVVSAQTEARALRTDEIRTAHLLLGVLVTADVSLRDELAGVGLTADAIRTGLDADPLGPDDAEALESIGIDLDAIRERMESTFGEGVLDRPSSGGGRYGRWGHVPFSRGARKSLELALREAIARRERTIGTEHLLLGILRSDDASALRLVEVHVDRESLRDLLHTRLDRAA